MSHSTPSVKQEFFILDSASVDLLRHSGEDRYPRGDHLETTSLGALADELSSLDR